MRILYLAPDAVPGHKGAAVRIALTVRTLESLGHEVELFTPAPASGLTAAHETVSLPEPNFLERMTSFRRAAARWLEGRRGDLVQFRGIWEGLPAVEWARQRGVPAVFEAHGFPSVELPYHFPALAGRLRLLEKIVAEERRVLAGSHTVIVPSRTSRLFLLRLGLPEHRVGVVPNAVDTDLFSPPAEPPPDAPPYRLVYHGTLAPWQGLGTLLEALALLRRGAGVELHVVGPARGPWRGALRVQARRLRVHHALHLSPPMGQPDLVPVLRTAHVCLAPLPADPRNALQGCCPLKLLEYMAAGRPIVSTRIGPVTEILDQDVTARLVEPGSAAALAQGLAWMLDHPEEREAMGRRARQVALALWTPDRFEARLAEALAGVVGAAALRPEEPGAIRRHAGR